MLHNFSISLDNKRVVLKPKGQIGWPHVKELQDGLVFLLKHHEEVVLDVSNNDHLTLLEKLVFEFRDNSLNSEYYINSQPNVLREAN